MSVLSTARQPDKSELLASFTNGVLPDSHLYSEEIAVQKAWAQGLCDMGLLSAVENNSIQNCLNVAYELMEAGRFEWKSEDEDIHMNLERFVNEKTGLGKKMHIGRSRNDLIATTLKLHVANSSKEISYHINNLIQALVGLAEKNLDVIIPGMTHLQNGQPIRMSHAFLGHAWALKRNQERFVLVANEAKETMPLGSAALGGTAIGIDLQKISKALGFVSPSMNSYDSVGDRSSVIAFLQAAAYFGANLSRLAEDIIYWSSSPVGLVKLSPQWSTGSSIMPNKRNPDVAELAKGKASLWMGDCAGVLTLVKGMATSYGSDLHESKIPYLRTYQDMKLTLNVFTHFTSELTVNKEKARALLNHGHILATEIADYLTLKGVPFREAYGLVAGMVEHADSKGLQVHELSSEDVKTYNKQLNADFFSNLNFESAVEKRNFEGGTSKEQVLKQINNLKKLN